MKKKVLIIEDDEVIRENTAEMLELANYEVYTESNGKLGVAKAKELIPDIIVCDIMMPELDGYGVLYMLGNNPKTSSIPFIFLSAKAEKSDVRQGMALGADDYLTKPFDEMDLINAIEVRLKRSEVFKQDFNDTIQGVQHFINEAKNINALEGLSMNREPQKYAKKSTIYYEGDSPNYLYYLNSGQIKINKLHEDGKQYITEIVKDGEFFGYFPIMEGIPYSESAIATLESEILRIPKDDFLSLIQTNRDVSSKFIKMISNSLVEREKLLLSFAYDTVRKRLANALLSLNDRYKSEGANRVKIEISRSDLASIVGTASETVVRTLSDFKGEQLIQVEGKKIILLDTEGLARIW